MTTSGPAPRLASSGAELVLDRIGAPPSENPVVSRMLDAADDAYGHVIEPISALRLLRLLVGARAATWICDPAADNPLLRAAISSGTQQELQPIDRLENTDVGRWATQVMLASAAGRPADTADPRAHLAGAVARLLGADAQLRPAQQTVIDSVLEQHDVLAVFRTGFGKSLCYQAPALALGAAGHGATVVISPLIALQRDQITTLRRSRVWEATAVNSDLDPATRGARLRGIRAGFYRVVYVAPEGLQSEGIRNALMAAGVALVAVDEAHCISEMGHNFRPDYRTIPVAIRRILGLGDDVRLADLDDRPQMLALTGTASPTTRDDIVERLDGHFRRHVDAQFVRPELIFDVIDVPEDPGRTGDVASDHPRRWQLFNELVRETKTPAVVYAPTQRDTSQLAELLTRSLGREIEAYHAGRSADERARIERAFLDGDTDLVVATNAFGMGVDKPDIRTVLHWRMPGSPEALYQEAGRAGRGPEGQPARCVVLYHPSDLSVAARIATWTVPNKHELTSVWSTLEELHRLQGERGSVVVSDEDLTRLAGLRPGIEASVVIAQLGNSGLIRERERQPAAFQVIGTGVALPSDLPMTEQAIAQLLPRDQEVAALSPAAIADWLAQAGLATSLRDIRAAIRHLESVGVIEHPSPTVGIRSLSGNPAAVVRNGWDDARRVARHIPPSGWVTVRPREAELPADRIITIVELLAVLGCVKVGQQSRGGFLPTVSRGERPFTELTRIAELSPGIASDAARATSPAIDLVALGERHGASVDEAREALFVGHILQAVMLDPRSWEQPGLTSSCRRITIEQPDQPPEMLIDETARSARSRNHDSDLRRRSLHAYAELDPPDGDGIVYQQFLERYFTDPTFLSDIEARDTQRILDGLDDDQLAAVRSDAWRLVVRAGAGTGKTRVLTRRIAFRVATGHATSSEIVAVCFGKDASSEMSVRLAALGVAGVRVQTLNALGWQIIREHWPKLGAAREPELITDGDQQKVIADLTRRHDGRTIGTKVKEIIQRAKLGLLAPGEAEGDDGVATELVNAVYAEYDEWLVANDKADYQDQIVRAVGLLRLPDVAGHVCGPVREVFVDEAQDLSVAEWALVHALSREASLTVVGDPRQAINEWKGADPGLFDQLSAESGTVTVDLVQNYRSRAQLLEVPNRVMAAYPPLEAVDTRDGDATAVDCTDEKQHDECIADLVTGWLDDGVADDEVAVICPTNAQVRRLAGRLRKAGVTTRTLGLPPLHRTEAFRIVQSELPKSYDPGTDDMIAAMERLATRSDIEDAIVAAAPLSEDDPWGDWHRLTAELAERERNGVINPIDALASIAADGQSAGDATGGVAVATIHKSKGLEWDAVVVAEATAKSLRNKPENRRLAYVALTRARSRRRVVSHVAGGGRSSVLSPLVGQDVRGNARAGGGAAHVT